MAVQRRGRKTDLRWTGSTVSQLAFSAGTAASQVLSAGLSRETLTRTRGSLIAYIDGASAPGKLVHCAVGLLVAQAGSAGAVRSAPLTDRDAPWFWYSEFTLGYEEMVTDVVDVPGISSYREQVDSKAMRVIRPDQDVIAVFENQTIGSAAAINVVLGVRILLGT